jgi:uncharacterized protein YpmS
MIKNTNTNWWRDNLVAILAILLPLILTALVFLFRSVIEHEIEIKNNSHDILENKIIIKDNFKTTRDSILYLDEKIDKRTTK